MRRSCALSICVEGDWPSAPVSRNIPANDTAQLPGIFKKRQTRFGVTKGDHTNIPGYASPGVTVSQASRNPKGPAAMRGLFVNWNPRGSGRDQTHRFELEQDLVGAVIHVQTFGIHHQLSVIRRLVRV